MACTSKDSEKCVSSKTVLERVNYFPRQIMTVDDMVAEAEYFREKLRRHNRMLHGWGVVFGLDVTPALTTGAPATVQIGGGYALDPYGDEIYVGESVLLDLSRCGPDTYTDPCEPNRLLNSSNGVGKTVFVAIKYFECMAKPVRAIPAGCACDEENCEYSRIRDSFEISCLNEWPGDPEPSPLCELRNKPVLCPPPPTTSWLVLAKATLPVGGNMIDTNMIDTTVRRQIFSTSQIQNQVIQCCCDKSAKLKIEKTSGPRRGGMTRDPEQIIPYMVKISNGGPGTAKGVTLTDDPEPKTVIKRGETFTVDKGSWKSGQAPKGPFIADLGDIGPGEGRTLTYDLVVNLTAGITVTNTVTVTSQTPNSGDTTKTHIDPEQHS